jgi:hypothetical protein
MDLPGDKVERGRASRHSFLPYILNNIGGDMLISRNKAHSNSAR